jgi:hypothetical protein
MPCARPRPDGGVTTGDRASDAPVLGASGAPIRLAALLNGPHWTLLGYGLDPAARAAAGFAPRSGLHVHAIGTHGEHTVGDVVDIEGEVQWAYGLSDGDWVLIRPDNVVAAIAGGDDLTGLRAYLTTVGLGC